MSTRGRRLFHWLAIHGTIVPILFYQVHSFGYDKGYKIGLKEGKEKVANTAKKYEGDNTINNETKMNL